MGNIKLDNLDGFRPALAALLEHELALTEIDELARHWAFKTPRGRAWLIYTFNWRENDNGEISEIAPGEQIRESEILTWAFVSELMQLNLEVEKAMAMVGRGITLRSLKSHLSSELADQVWDSLIQEVGDRRGTGVEGGEGATLIYESLEEVVNDPLVGERVSELLPNESDDPSRVEVGFLERWEVEIKFFLEKTMEEMKNSIKDVEQARLEFIGIPEEQARGLVLQGISLDDIQSASASGLAARQWALIEDLITGGMAMEQAVDHVVGDQELSDGITRWTQNYAIGKPTPEERTRQWLESKRFRKWKDLLRKDDDSGKSIDDLFLIEFYDLIVVSDFHVAAGNHPTPEGITRFSPTEDFFFDDAFFRFLHQMENERSARGGYPYELIINGDFIDFVQLVIRPTEDDELDRSTVPPLDKALWKTDESTEVYYDDLILKNIDEVYQQGSAERVISEQVQWNSSASRKSESRKVEESMEMRRQIADSWMGEDLKLEAVADQIQAGIIQQSSPAWGEEDWAQWSTDEWKGLKDWSDEDIEEWAADTEEMWMGDAGAAPAKPEGGTWDEWYEEAWQEYVEYAQEQVVFGKRTVLAMNRRKALKQLSEVYLGHRNIFRAIAWFVAQGNRLLIIRGNHDPHWYWPEVQHAFVFWLHKAFHELRLASKQKVADKMPVCGEDLRLTFPETTVDDFASRVEFNYSWFYYRDRLVYLEHGGQHEVVDANRYFLAPVKSIDKSPGKSPFDPESASEPPVLEEWLPELVVGPEEVELDPPLGSLGNVYLINRLEIEMPNFERPGYDKVYLPWQIFDDPILFTRVFFGSLGRLVKGWWHWTLDSLTAAKIRHMERRKAYAALTGMPMEAVTLLDETDWVRRIRQRRFGLILRAGILVVPVLPILFFVLGVVLASIPPLDAFLKTREPQELVVVDAVLDLLKRLAFGTILGLIARRIIAGAGLGEDYLFTPSKRVAEILRDYHRDVPYILFGHDHAHNVQAASPDQKSDKGLGVYEAEVDRWYMNTGTWLHMYAKERKRLLRTEHEYTFVRMVDTHRVLAADNFNYMKSFPHCRPKVQLLRWNDNIGKVELPEIFAGRDEEEGDDIG